MKQCPKCYKIVDDDMNFCPGCGEKLAVVSATAKTDPNSAADRYFASREAEIKKAEIARAADEQKHTKRHWVLGNVVTFGSCYQNDFNMKEPIEWVICKVGNGTAYLLSKYILECWAFDISHVAANWLNSDLRARLNKTFLKESFTLGERKRIVKQRYAGFKLFGRYRRRYGKVFCFDGTRILNSGKFSGMTKIAEQELLRQGLKNPEQKWWVHDPRVNSIKAYRPIRSSTEFVCSDERKEDMSIGVRPAIWVKIPKE